MSDQQKTFLDIKDRLHPAARERLNMPDFGQVDQNLVNMSNFFPLIRGLIDAVAPSSICEIGCDQGMTTRVLKEYCKTHGCELHAVDPAFERTGQVDEFLYMHKCLSFEYLESQPSSEIYFLDGDHNYHTVDSELRLIHDKKPAGGPCVVFLHDVGWPCGRIDMYYDKTNIPEEKRKATAESSLISLFEGADPNLGQGLSMNEFSIARDDDGKAGVATAIEHFLADYPQWDYTDIPSIYGLGIMVFRGAETDQVSLRFNEIKNLFEKFKEFLSVLEFNRIALLEKVNYSGAIWSRQQAVIEEYGETIDGLKQDLEKHEQLLNVNEEMSREIESLRNNISGLQDTITRISSFSGWIMHHIRRFMK